MLNFIGNSFLHSLRSLSYCHFASVNKLRSITHSLWFDGSQSINRFVEIRGKRGERLAERVDKGEIRNGSPRQGDTNDWWSSFTSLGSWIVKRFTFPNSHQWNSVRVLTTEWFCPKYWSQSEKKRSEIWTYSGNICTHCLWSIWKTQNVHKYDKFITFHQN